MDWLDQELKSALERKQPPSGFAERVVAQAEASGTRKPIEFRPRSKPSQWYRWVAAAAAVVVLAGAGLEYRQRQGEAARDQVLLALKITATKVNQIQSQVQEAAQ